MCDSGGENGRHWQRNQKRTLADFKADPVVSVHFDPRFSMEVFISVFHLLNTFLVFDSDGDEQLREYMERHPNDSGWAHIDKFLKKSSERPISRYARYTYNEDNMLSQDIQFLGPDRRDRLYLSIHNGADARGGLTMPRCFTLRDHKEDYWGMWTSEDVVITGNTTGSPEWDGYGKLRDSGEFDNVVEDLNDAELVITDGVALCPYTKEPLVAFATWE